MNERYGAKTHIVSVSLFVWKLKLCRWVFCSGMRRKTVKDLWTGKCQRLQLLSRKKQEVGNVISGNL